MFRYHAQPQQHLGGTMFSNDEEEASIGATADENSEASSHNTASASGLEEQETVDPPGEVPVHPTHDPLGFLSEPRLDFDMDRDSHPFDETALSPGISRSDSEAWNRVDGAMEETKSTTNEDTPEAQNRINAEESSNNSSQETAAGETYGQYGTEGLGEGVLRAPNEVIFERQRVWVQSTIEIVQEHPDFQNAASEHVREMAKMIVESLQIHLGASNQSIPEISLDEFNQMVQLTLEINYILPNDGVPPNVNDNAFSEDAVSETDEVKITAPTLQAQSNASENSGNEPKNKRPHNYKCKFCGELKKGGHVCSATRCFDAWTDMTKNSHIPAEILGEALIEGDRDLEVSREEWTPCVMNQDLSSDLDLEPQDERVVAQSAKSRRQMEQERLKKKRKTADCLPPPEGHLKEEQEKQEADLGQPKSVTEDYAAASNVDTTTATEAFRAADISGETDAPHLAGNEAETQQQQQQPGPLNQDAIPEDSNHVRK